MRSTGRERLDINAAVANDDCVIQEASGVPSQVVCTVASSLLKVPYLANLELLVDGQKLGSGSWSPPPHRPAKRGKKSGKYHVPRRIE